MSLKEILESIKDLIESNKQLTLRLKMIEIEINYIKENLPRRITNLIEKTEKIDRRISQKYINELLNKKTASASTYQKGSMDEILIHKFLEKQKLKEKDLYNIDSKLEKDSEETDSEIKESKE